MCLRGLKLPHNKKEVLARVRYTGLGSNQQDLVDACPKLGLVGRALHAPGRKALLALPKPLVAYRPRDAESWFRSRGHCEAFLERTKPLRTEEHGLLRQLHW